MRVQCGSPWAAAAARAGCGCLLSGPFQKLLKEIPAGRREQGTPPRAFVQAAGENKRGFSQANGASAGLVSGILTPRASPGGKAAAERVLLKLHLLSGFPRDCALRVFPRRERGAETTFPKLNLPQAAPPRLWPRVSHPGSGEKEKRKKKKSIRLVGCGQD